MILVAYLVHLKTGKVGWFFDITLLTIIGFTPLYVFTRILGVELLGFITSMWRTWATPAIYLGFTTLTIAASYVKTDDLPYSVTLATHITLATGYLYEAPRYLYLQGLRGMLRFNKLSLFRLDYAIVSLPIIAWLLYRKNLRVDRITVAAVAFYLAYFVIFYSAYDWLREIRFRLFYGYMIPWINLYRFPAMIMFLALISGIGYPDEDMVE